MKKVAGYIKPVFLFKPSLLRNIDILCTIRRCISVDISAPRPPSTRVHRRAAVAGVLPQRHRRADPLRRGRQAGAPDSMAEPGRVEHHQHPRSAARVQERHPCLPSLLRRRLPPAHTQRALPMCRH